MCVAVLLSLCPATGTAQGVRALTAADQEQLIQLREVIIGPNAAQARRYGARQVLNEGWPQGIELLRGILAESKDTGARLAVAEAIAKAGGASEAFIDPLIGLLGNGEASLRKAAGTALASYKNHGVAGRLGAVAADGQADFTQRLAAIDALSQISDHSAIEPLIALLDDGNAEIHSKAGAALHTVTGVNAGPDAAAWKRWWQKNRGKTRLQWMTDLNEMLSKRTSELQSRLDQMAERLRRSLTEQYQQASESERPAMLVAWLQDPLDQVRLHALDQVRGAAADRRSLGDEVGAQVRKLVADPSSAVRKAVMATLRYPPHEPGDNALMLGQFKQEADSQVRAAILATLGRTGDETALPAVIEALSDASPVIAAGAAEAIAALVERGEADQASAGEAVALLVKRLDEIPADAWPLRQRFLEAMAGIGNGHFRAVFIAHATADYPAAIRKAALRGLAKTAQTDSEGADLLAKGLVDSDAGVRLVSAAGLGQVGRIEDMALLLDRVDAGNEPDEQVRMAASAGFERRFRAADVDQQLAWLARVMGSVAEGSGDRFVTLAAVVAERLTDRPAELLALHRETAAVLAELGRASEAAVQMEKALAVADVAKYPNRAELAAAVVRAWLDAGQPDRAIGAAALALKGGASDSTEAVLKVLTEYVRELIGADRPAEAVAQLAKIEGSLPANPATSWSEMFVALGDAARQALATQDAERVSQAVGLLSTGQVDRAKELLHPLGRRAGRYVAAELMRLVDAPAPNASLELAMLAVLVELVEGFEPYPADADTATKLACIRPLVGGTTQPAPGGQ